jgi:N-acetylmuramate 1-kinase
MSSALPSSVAARDTSRTRFLSTTEWANADVQPFAEDASFRRYFRLIRGAKTVLLMDAPPPRERVAPFAEIAEHLQHLGLSSPQIYARDDEQGWLLIEDFGDATFTRLLNAKHDETTLYQHACDALIALHRHPHATSISAPEYSLERLLDEADLLVDWHYPAINGARLDATATQSYRTAWSTVFAALTPLPETLVLRDYHVDNLMLLGGREDIQACGLLDFQDALIGSPAYDFASLIEDARRIVSPTVIAHLWERYLSAFPDLDATLFASWFRALAAQRHAKVAGIFVRLRDRDGKNTYLHHVPRVVNYLATHLGHEQMRPVADWFSVHYPNYQIPVPST